MSSQVRPAFFCSRPNGLLTPLIALDDLPAGVNVRGVSRTLTPSDTQGMISCGAAEPRSEPWTLDGAPQTGRVAITSNEDLAELEGLLMKILADDNVSTHLRMAIKGVLYGGLDAAYHPGAPTKAVTGRRSNSPTYYGHAGHGKHGFNTKKEFCSYWIRHGECDYQQQGCLYKHEMPTDIFMLEKLGLRDIPRWYREKFNVPSLLQVNYGNNNRGQQPQTVIDQPQHKAIQFQSAANSVNNAGLAAHAGPSANTGTAANAGPSGHNANGNANAGKKNNTGNGNGNQHGQAHSRGGRYKSPRGAGFAGGNKGRINNGGKAGDRNGVTPPPPTTSGNGTPGTASPGPSNVASSGISPRMTPGISPGTQQSLLASPIVGPSAVPISLIDPQGQHLLDKEGMARRKSLAERMRELTMEDVYGGPSAGKQLPVKDFFRTKSRFQFGADGGEKKIGIMPPGTVFNPYAGLEKFDDHNAATSAAPASPLSELVATSEPIDPNEPLVNWGPIGEPVRHPSTFMNWFGEMGLRPFNPYAYGYPESTALKNRSFNAVDRPIFDPYAYGYPFSSTSKMAPVSAQAAQPGMDRY